jgi:hypothetical protein
MVRPVSWGVLLEGGKGYMRDGARFTGRHVQAWGAVNFVVVKMEKAESLRTRAEPRNVEAVQLVGGK